MLLYDIRTFTKHVASLADGSPELLINVISSYVEYISDPPALLQGLVSSSIILHRGRIVCMECIHVMLAGLLAASS